MPLTLLVVFLTVFAVFALVMMAVGGRTTPPETVRATLDLLLHEVALYVARRVVDLRKNSALSSIPWMNRLLAQVRPAAELRRILEQADLAWTPGRLLLTAVASWLVAAYTIHFKTGAVVVSVVLALGVGAAPFLYVWNKRQRRFNHFLKVLPDSIDLMVSALRAGNSTMGALGIVASQAPEPVRREFRISFDEQSYGVDLRAAMENLLVRVPLADLRIITTAILIQKESGGNLAEILDKTAQTIRDRFRLQDQIRIHTAQGRMTGWILSLLPVVMGIVLFVGNSKYIMLLFDRPLGHKMLTGGAILNLIGLLVIRKIIRIQI